MRSTTKNRSVICKLASSGEGLQEVTLPLWARVVINLVTLAGLIWIIIVLPFWGKMLFLGMIAFIAIHEAGHYRVAKKLGIPIEEVGVGLPTKLGKQLMVQLPLPRLPFRVRVSPLLVAVYVEEGEEGRRILKQKSYSEQAYFFSVGIMTHLVTATFLLAAYAIVTWDFSADLALRIILIILIMVTILKLIEHYPTKFAAIMPLLGFGVIYLIAREAWPSISNDPLGSFLDGEVLAGQILGPVTIANLVAETADVETALFWGFVLSLGLGMTNLLPLSMLDGGQLFDALMEKLRIPNKWRSVVKLGWVAVFGLPLVAIMLRSEFGIIGLWLMAVVLIMIPAAMVFEGHRKRCSLHQQPGTSPA